ncbi:MAG: hypothetical protein EOO70_09580 [Myxococcaceae bacterium]|nr:MAG: hypothetical protein EOO70_09580 [Myxococcaceae bacterium]
MNNLRLSSDIHNPHVLAHGCNHDAYTLVSTSILASVAIDGTERMAMLSHAAREAGHALTGAAPLDAVPALQVGA